MVTGEDGLYRFEGLMPGDYSVAAVFPEGRVPVETGDARLQTEISVLTQFDGHGGESEAVDLAMGLDQLDLDVGCVLPGSLGDLVWLDEDGDGLQDWNEGGIPNVTVHLWRNDTEVASAVTDQYGFFTFEELYPAAYVLSADVPGCAPTGRREDLPIISSVLEADGSSVPVQVISNAHNYDADLGFVLLTPGAYPEGYGQGETQNWQEKAE